MAARRYFNGRYVNTFMPVLKKDGVVVSPYLIGFERSQGHSTRSTLTDTIGLLWDKSWVAVTKALQVTDSDLTAPIATVPYTILDATTGPTLVVPPLSDEDAYHILVVPALSDEDAYHKKLVDKLRKMIWKEQRRYSMDVYGFCGSWECSRVLSGHIDDWTYHPSYYLIGEVVFGPRGGARFVEREDKYAVT